MAPRRPTSTRLARDQFQNTACSNTPMPMPASIAPGRLSMRASTAAASAGSSSAGPLVKLDPDPMSGAASMADSAESTAATAHTTVDSRRTGMPSSMARSALAELARIATPTALRRRNSVIRPSTTGTTISTCTWAPENSSGETWNDSRSGVLNPPDSPPSGPPPPNSDGSVSSMPDRIWARPMVATVSTSRGAQKNRWMTSRSASAPTSAAVRMPAAKAA